MAQTTDEQTAEREAASMAMHAAAVEVNRLRNTYSAGMHELVQLEVKAKRLAEYAHKQTAESATLAEIRKTRKELLTVSEQLREMAAEEAELIEKHGAACKLLRVKWETFDKQRPQRGVRFGMSENLRQMGVSLDPLPDLVNRAAGNTEKAIADLAEKGI